MLSAPKICQVLTGGLPKIPKISTDRYNNHPHLQIPENSSGKQGDRKPPSAPENTPAKVPAVPEPVTPAKRAIAPQNDMESQAAAVRSDAQEVAHAAEQLADILMEK
ncbi:hypothetical protein HC766_07510 [Candidatus Gracilibacteria bacterium]|nr:hypothetical protein [Candidatus Gracilibacteria bacterium]